MNNPQTGENTVVLWTPSGGVEVELSEFGRNANTDETANSYDTTTYSEAQDGYETHIPGLATGEHTMEIMYQVGDSATYNSLAPRTKGTLKIRDEGTGSGKPQEVWANNTHITGRSKPRPYNDVMVMTVTWKLSGIPDRTAQA